MSEIRKFAANLAAVVAGCRRLTATDEERAIARLRGLRTDLIDSAISVDRGRVIKRTGDGILIEFRSVVDVARYLIEVQNGMVEHNAGLPPERQIWFRAGIHRGDMIEEADCDVMGKRVNIAARLEGICKAGWICLTNPADAQVRDKIAMAFLDLDDRELKDIARPARPYAVPLLSKDDRTIVFGRELSARLTSQRPHLSIVVLPFASSGADPEDQHFVGGLTESLTTDLSRITYKDPPNSTRSQIDSPIGASSRIDDRPSAGALNQ